MGDSLKAIFLEEGVIEDPFCEQHVAYSLTTDGLNPIPTFSKFNPASRIFSVYTNAGTNNGIFNLAYIVANSKNSALY